MSEAPDTSIPATETGTHEGDIELLLDLRRGEPESLGAVYDRFGRVVYSLASRMLSDRREIEEVTQDVFLAMWKKPANFHPEKSSPVTWIATITRNKCIDRLRKAGRRIPAMVGEIEEGLQVADERRGADPFLVSALHELSEQVRECLSRLSESQRSAVEFAYFECLSMKEIAAQSSIPSGTVKSRLRLALDRLKRCLQPQRNQ